METQKPDYSAFLALFQGNELVLTDGMQISGEACQLIEQIGDDAITHDLVALSGGVSIEMINRDAVIEQRAPYVWIFTDSGRLMIPAYELRLVPFEEVVQRLQGSIETFELFLSSERISHAAYRWNLYVWRKVNAVLVGKYRAWLSQYVPQAEHHTKLNALTLYCQLAVEEGHIETQEMKQILMALENPKKKHSKLRSNKGSRK